MDISMHKSLWPASLVLSVLFCVIESVPFQASAPPGWRAPYAQSSYYYSDYSYPKVTPKKTFLPTPQFCPETGRTVCANVKPFYPINEVFEVISTAKAKKFNLTSEFMDESENDDEPYLQDFEPQFDVPKRDGYVYYQTSLHYEQPRQQINGYSQNSAFNPNFQPAKNVPLKQSYIAGNNNNPYQQFNNANYQNNNNNQWPQPYRPSINSRYKRQVANEADSVCSSRVILVEPKAALNDKGQWKFIVNLAERDPRLKQAIKVEVCTTPNQPCSNQISLPFGFVSRCRQKYIKKKLLSLDASGQSTSTENFFAPSCCVCEIVRNNLRK